MIPRLPVVVFSKKMLCPILTTKLLESSTSIVPVTVQLQTITQTYASSFSLGLFFWFLFRKK
jgi:hypothetical protein